MSGINGIGTSNTVKTVDPDKVGFSGLTSEDFMKILIVQLQNQDPTSPMESDQLLSQISDMRALQANVQLETALKSLTLSQQLGSATAFLGKTVTGSAGDSAISGVVSSVQVRDGQALLNVNGATVELKNVTSVTP